jgi:3D (Asp-Asp-Asp) domain-containing protein
MNGTFALTSPSTLVRWTLVFVAAICSAAVLGAAEANSPKLTVSTVAKPAVNGVVSPADSGRELMQDVAPGASTETTTASLDAHKKTVWLEVTAYCGCAKCCGPHAQGLTASGRSIAYNGGQFVAADKKLFKFGTRLSIPGYAGGQPVEVIDRGGAIKGYHIDVFFPTHEQAKQWGRKWIAVTIEE